MAIPRHPQRARGLAAGLATAVVITSGTTSWAAPSDGRTVVDHDVTYSEYFDGDICGLAANLTTWTAQTAQQQFLQRQDGSWLYREVSVVTYTSDYVDPSLPDLTGRLTEVNHYNLTPGDTFVASEPFHDFFGDVKIWWRYHLTVVDGEPVVERFIVDWVGCPGQ